MALSPKAARTVSILRADKERLRAALAQCIRVMFLADNTDVNEFDWGDLRAVEQRARHVLAATDRLV